MTTWLMVAASAHLALIVVEHQRRLRRSWLMPNAETIGVSAHHRTLSTAASARHCYLSTNLSRKINFVGPLSFYLSF